MFASDLFKGRNSKLVLAATVAAGVAAAIASAPSSSIGRESDPAPALRQLGVEQAEQGVRPLASGPAMRLGRAYGAEDEDCTVVVTKSPDGAGRMRVKRAVTCAD